MIPVRHLVNGSSIARVEVETVTYYHVELDRHDVLLAEGLPVESFLDVAGRPAFADFGRLEAARPAWVDARREAESYAPFVVTGPQLEQVRRDLAALAAIPASRSRAWPAMADSGGAN